MFKKKRKVLDFSRHFPKKILLESKDNPSFTPPHPEKKSVSNYYSEISVSIYRMAVPVIHRVFRKLLLLYGW